MKFVPQDSHSQAGSELISSLIPPNRSDQAKPNPRPKTSPLETIPLICDPSETIWVPSEPICHPSSTLLRPIWDHPTYLRPSHLSETIPPIWDLPATLHAKASMSDAIIRTPRLHSLSSVRWKKAPLFPRVPRLCFWFWLNCCNKSIARQISHLPNLYIAIIDKNLVWVCTIV